MEPVSLPAPGRLVSVNVATAFRYDSWAGGPDSRSGIDKRAAAGRVAVRDHQVIGDLIGDLTDHGGLDQAVYAYAREDAAWWEAELDRALPPGSFGENLSTEGVDVTGAVIGERWAIGSAVFEVSGPRIPCRVFAGFWDVPQLVKRFTVRGDPGAYLRILVEGEVGAGDRIDIVHRPAHGATISDVFRALTGDRSLAPRLVEVAELPENHRNRFRKWLAEPAIPQT
jgi:MOSC domain-containing protein YiiM